MRAPEPVICLLAVLTCTAGAQAHAHAQGVPDAPLFIEEPDDGDADGDGDGDGEDDEPDPWAPRERGVRTHDGFMFRVAIGATYAAFTEHSAFAMVGAGAMGSVERVEQELSVQGLGLLLSLDVGTALGDAVSVHLRLSEMSVPDPMVEMDGRELSPRGDTTRAPTLIAPAVTYFLMPLNLYATAAFGLAVVRKPGFEGDTNLGDLGFGLNVDVGKEWWAHSQWGVGAAARLWWVTSSGEDDNGFARESEGLAVGALLSVTYQ